jgi:DNA-binding MarR family transcriptional regulator
MSTGKGTGRGPRQQPDPPIGAHRQSRQEEKMYSYGNYFRYYVFVHPSVNTVTTTPSAATEIDLAGSAADLDRLRVVALRIARRIRSNAPETITASEFSMLGTVMVHGPCTISFIAEVEHVQPPSASKIVASLEQQGFVTRQADSNDRRCSPIVITDAGRDMVAHVRAAGRSWLASRLTDLTDAEIRLLGEAVPVLERLLGPNDDGTRP